MDRLLDLWYTVSDLAIDAWWWVTENVKTTIMGVGFILFVILSFVVYNNQSGSGIGYDSATLPENSEEQLEYMQTKSDELKEVFSELQIINTSPDNYPVLEIDLYLKQPFMRRRDVESYLNTYIDLLKLRYNDSKSDTRIKAVRIEIYDREVVFSQNLPSNGTYTYMLASEYVDEPRDDYDNRNRSMYDIGWEQTTMQSRTPDYNRYAVYFDYQELREDASVQPLSDEEFEWYLKFEQYAALAGGVPGAARLYLQWELGANTTQGGYLAVIDSFNIFVDRLRDINARRDFYSDDPDSLRRQLVITNPQFLLFADHGEIIEDPYEARARLININSSLYTRPVERWIENRAGNYTSLDDPASVDNPDNMTNTQLLESEALESQEEDILNQSSED